MNISQDGYKSADLYFKFLDQNNLGLVFYNIVYIKEHPDEIEFIIEGFLPKNIELSYGMGLMIDNLMVDPKDYSFESYARKAHSIRTRVSEILRKKILSSTLSTIKIFSDLKFLVERVADWYLNFGDLIKIPTNAKEYEEFEDSGPYTSSDNQIEVITNILNEPFSYVWGPPGTGKTQYVMSKCVAHYLKQGKKVVLVAPTNASLEQMLYGVLKILESEDIPIDKVKRLGDPSDEFYHDYKKVCLTKEERRSGEYFSDSLCLAMTIDRFIYNYVEISEIFDPYHIFLDEAGFCSLIKGACLLAIDTKITFLGDHMQLPPVCTMDDTIIRKSANYEVVLWSQSALFIEDYFDKTILDITNRYFMHENPEFKYLIKYDLTKSFRFSADFAKILDLCVYENGLEGNSLVDTKVYYIDCPHNDSTIKRTSMSEASAIFDLLHKAPDTLYGVITPYINQRELIKKLTGVLVKNYTIMTVHGSQGKEWDNVILSVVDTADMYYTNSLSSYSNGAKVLNTAISRVKGRLILCLDYEFWSSQPNQLIGRLLTIAKPFNIKEDE